ncbi:MAG: chlorite dismutase family protein [Myxococcales bacterium]|nr:chlorite dismutase family protein [Polyangiaceae bacterium]MDW8248282.1 chlorite dismutase family protein [Myxococcales bacterium]
MTEVSSHPNSPGYEARPGLPVVDIYEYGGKRNGERQSLNRRLFFQLLVFRSARDGNALAAELIQRLRAAEVPGVVYADTMDPRGFGLLTWSEAPEQFIQRVRPLFSTVLKDEELRSDVAMIGRTYSSGHEPDLEHWLLRRPVENVTNVNYPWHVWYPLRRIGSFNRIDAHEQATIMREHAALGMAYGQQELAHDIRLACHGLDTSDNEFVIGLVGRELYPLSHLVQAMRKTRQTAEFIAHMGPFFVGHVLARTSPEKG